MAAALSANGEFPAMPSTHAGWTQFYRKQSELWNLRKAIAEAEVDQLALMVELSALTAGILLDTAKEGFRLKVNLIMTQQVLAGIIKTKLEAQDEKIKQSKTDLEE